MINRVKIKNTGLRNDTFVPLEKKLEVLMNSDKYCGFNKYLKWSIMAYVFNRLIEDNDFEGKNIEKYAEYYLGDVWASIKS